MVSRDELLRLVEEAQRSVARSSFGPGWKVDWLARAKTALDERAADVAAEEKRRNCVHEWEPGNDLAGMAVFRCKHDCGAFARLKLLAVDNWEGKANG
jgi:hypothetical protein